MVDDRFRRRGGDAVATPFDCILLRSIRIASFLWKVNVGSGTSFLPRARACTQFTSATDNRKVNCRLGHHFICHTSSNPIGSCRRLLTSSTQCLARLWRLKGSAYLNIFHSTLTKRHVLDFLKDPMRWHDLRDVVCITGAVDEETHPSQLLNEHFCMTQRLHCLAN